jgi:uncharacterized membrane protein
MWQTLAVLVNGGLLIVLTVAFHRANPTVSPRIVFAFTPWIISVGGLYALEQANVFPPSVAPFFALPIVYATLGVLLLGTWLGMLSVPTTRSSESAIATTLFTVGSVLGGVVFLLSGRIVVSSGTSEVVWPAVAVLLAGAVTAGGWRALLYVRPQVRTVGRFGPLVVFSHSLDAISTAVGLAVLGTTERNPISALLIDATAGLPVINIMGPAGGFVVVKLLLAGGIVWLFSGMFRDDPMTGALTLEVVAGSGLAPGVHNVVLFSVT